MELPSGTFELPSGTFNVSYAQDMAIVRTHLHWGLLLTFLLLLLLLPFYTSGYITDFIIVIAINVIAVHGLNILTGYCGQLSIGHAAFVAVGAYTSAFLCLELGLSFWASLPCAGIGAGLVGVIFGLPSLKVKGLYLAVATLAAQFIIAYVIMNARDLTGGSSGLPVAAPTIGSMIFNSPKSFYYIAIPIAILMTFFATNIVRTRVGRAFIAIRDNDIAAEVMGINLYVYKLLAFFTACFFAGIAGSLWAHYSRVALPDAYNLTVSIWFIGMLIVGGIGSVLGVILGTAFIKILDQLVVILGTVLARAFPAISSNITASLSTMLFGIVIILFLVFEPRGLAHRWSILKTSYRLRPFSY